MAPQSAVSSSSISVLSLVLAQYTWNEQMRELVPGVSLHCYNIQVTMPS
jgi:hypothetical protein